MTEENKHYRYCFQCDKWKKKDELNEVDYGDQPGHESGVALYCKDCQHELTGEIQIFHCHKHEEEILKVWGVMDGETKEKVFYEKCPQEQNQQELSWWEKIPLPAKIGGGVITVLLGILATAKLWLGKATKHAEKAEDKLKDIQKKIAKEKKLGKSKNNQDLDIGLEIDDRLADKKPKPVSEDIDNQEDQEETIE